MSQSTVVMWSKSKPDVEFQYGGRSGEFNVVKVPFTNRPTITKWMTLSGMYTWQFRYDESWYFGIIFATTWHALVHLQWPASLPTLSRVLPSLARILPSVRPSRSCPVSKREHIRNLFHRLAAMPVAGRFATLPVCHLDVSLPPVSCDPRRFATWAVRHLDVLLPGRFAISLDVSPHISKLVICDTGTVTNSANLIILYGRRRLA